MADPGAPFEIIVSDVRGGLATRADKSVHCVVTSVPYWNLRDYGVEGQIGLEPEHDCLAWGRGEPPCGACFICTMREVFGGEERDVGVWRVMRDDAVLWLNIGDCYISNSPGSGPSSSSGLTNPDRQNALWNGRKKRRPSGLKLKDQACAPERIRLALQADGWYARGAIVWHKPNPMPESVTDRPTIAHEHIFLFTKSAAYFYDAEAVKEPTTGNAHARASKGKAGQHPKTAASGSGVKANESFQASTNQLVTERNLRTVWTIPTRPFKDAHFATFPPEIPERCILAGTSARGCCPTCGAPWARTFAPRAERGDWLRARDDMVWGQSAPKSEAHLSSQAFYDEHVPRRTTGWSPTCSCERAEPVPCVVLDPFAGAGTTLVVALQHGRRAIGIELNPAYADIARRRIVDEAPTTREAHARAARRARTEQATLPGGAEA